MWNIRSAHIVILLKKYLSAWGRTFHCQKNILHQIKPQKTSKWIYSGVNFIEPKCTSKCKNIYGIFDVQFNLNPYAKNAFVFSVQFNNTSWIYKHQNGRLKHQYRQQKCLYWQYDAQYLLPKKQNFKCQNIFGYNLNVMKNH